MCHDFRGGVGGGRVTLGMFSYTEIDKNSLLFDQCHHALKTLLK